MRKVISLLLVIAAIGTGIYYYYQQSLENTQPPLSPAINYTYKSDQVITNDVYTSYFNYGLHQPLYVKYKLYQGGGDCNRKHMHFKTGNLYNSASVEDYKHSLYDEGHLCPAEDEAYDCVREEETFRYYNCLPQKPKLNRGVWKVWETQVRQESQQDSLLILCGGIFGSKTIGQAAVPDYCWKLVFSLTTHRVLHCLIFPNDDNNSVERTTVSDLQQRAGYKIDIAF